MEINAFASTLPSDQAVSDVLQQIKASLLVPDLLIVAFNTDLAADQLQQQFTTQFNCPILGGSSCLGSLTLSQQQHIAHATISVLVIQDPDGDYAVGECRLQADYRSAACDALDTALDRSKRGAESPALIWCILPPGNEETILEGFADIVGPHIPVLGGSSADNDVSGQWQQFSHHHSGHDQITVAVLYPSSPIGTSFSSGYEPSGETAIATSVQERTLSSLDGQPAAQYYNDWSDQAIHQQLNGGNVLALTTLHPLGRKIPSPSGIDDYLLSHPDAVTESGALSLFSIIDEGEELHLMRGSRASLIKRAGKVLDNACQLIPEGHTPKGALMIYCAGCMLTIDEDIQQMVTATQCAVQNIPLIGFYTFGEQGCFLDGQNRHGNLMISAVVFSD